MKIEASITKIEQTRAMRQLLQQPGQQQQQSRLVLQNSCGLSCWNKSSCAAVKTVGAQHAMLDTRVQLLHTELYRMPLQNAVIEQLTAQTKRQQLLPLPPPPPPLPLQPSAIWKIAAKRHCGGCDDDVGSGSAAGGWCRAAAAVRCRQAAVWVVSLVLQVCALRVIFDV